MSKYIGKRLDGRYEIEELIGIGGMADVYKAHDIVEEKTVAVKILKDEYLSNEDFKRRFRNESKAIAVLSHPNIVKIYDVSFGDRIQFIVMEYVNGITLKEYIEQQKMVTWKEAVHFTVQILRALQHAHDNGIVHRDVKPQNVMLMQDGSVKVMDFGIARFARDNGRTISEKAIGSVHYISPEQAKGEVTDERTDIYSVGVMMFEMLTGKLPFDGDTPVTVALKQMQTEPETPRSLNPDIPVGLEEIIIRAMKKDPDLRYQTAAEMLRDIDEFKRNPETVFEYRYFTEEKDTQYFDDLMEDEQTDVEKKRISPTMQILMAVTAACVLIAIIAVVIFFMGIKETTPDLEMYDFIGLEYSKILEDDRYSNVEIVEGDRELSDQYEAGVVIDQKPKPGERVKEGAKVTLKISSGLKAQEVPDVYGLDKEEAKEMLEKAGFKVTLMSKFDDSQPEDTVLYTSPGKNEEATIGQTIKVYYSAGKNNAPVLVPKLVGLTQAQATRDLQALGLIPKAVEKDSSEAPGMVIGQVMMEGTPVTQGTPIEFYVSNGKTQETTQRITVPFASNAADKKFDFEIYIDGVKETTLSLNPAKSKQLVWEHSASGEKQVVIRVGGQTFVIIDINYDTGEFDFSSPNHDLIKKEEVSSEEPSSSESSSESSGESSESSESSSSESSSSESRSGSENSGHNEE